VPLSFIEALDRAMPWRKQALCADYPKLHWVDDLTAPLKNPAHLLPMLEICARCPVRRPCLEFALSAIPEMHGVLGGTAHIERRRALRPSVLVNAEETGRKAMVQRAADMLEATLEERIERWRSWAASGVTPEIGATCAACEALFHADRRGKQIYCPACEEKRAEGVTGLGAEQFHEEEFRRARAGKKRGRPSRDIPAVSRRLKSKRAAG
jgi:hypothetical protein